MISLENFSHVEFRTWTEEMSPKLLVLLDLFRHRWGAACRISPVKGAIGRFGKGTSQHHYDTWGEVRAIDILPEGLVTRADAERAINIAIECGITGIGLYPHWRPQPGLHLDVRVDRKMGDPALWGAKKVEVEGTEKQVYIGLEEAYLLMPEAA